jgi:hypothetical protein
MNIDTSQVPGINSESPFSIDDLYAMGYGVLAVDAAAQVAKSTAQCVPSPASMPSPKLAVEAAVAQESQVTGMTRNTAVFNPIIQATSGQGATIEDADMNAAPQVIPFINVPSAQPGTGRRTFPAKRRVRQPGTPWGSTPAATTDGPCATPGFNLAGSIRANPLGSLFIAAGLGVILYAAMK